MLPPARVAEFGKISQGAARSKCAALAAWCWCRLKP